MKKTAIILVLILSVAMVFAACGQQDKIRISLSEVTHSVFYAPQYVAINLGFFEEQGLEVELSNGQGADKVMTAVLSGQVDIGFAGPEASIYVYNEGREDYAVVFAQLTKRDGSFLVGRTPEPDFKWENLRGKSIIGGRKGGVPEMTLEYVLKKHGLMPNQDLIVDTSIQFAAMAGAFTGGEGDYVTLFEPTATMLEKEGKGYVLASVGMESGEIPYTAYFAKKSYIEKNKDIIQRFTNAIYKGQQWVEQHTPKEIAEVIRPSFPDTDLEILEAVAQRYKEIDAWCQDPVMTEESLNRLQDVMEEAGELKNRVPHDKIVDNSFARKAMETMKQ
ncbi:MAG TPA: ABC transporter substrate-binding protein [Thermoclostridium caenicola]|nr:ABC transporter substrate-binding protein [Thermoclostridium caenicola]